MVTAINLLILLVKRKKHRGVENEDINLYPKDCIGVFVFNSS